MCSIFSTILVFLGLSGCFFGQYSSHKYIPRNNTPSNITKDIGLLDLAEILNLHKDAFAEWKSNSHSIQYFNRFLKILIPWVTAEPPATIMVNNPFPSSIDCSDFRFRHFLTGGRLMKPRIIVDFIPFGYDLDKLEVRLLENYDLVEAFVIFESQISQTGIAKPLIFDMVKDTVRFLRFRKKIIHITATREEMLRFAGQRRRSTCQDGWDGVTDPIIHDNAKSGDSTWFDWEMSNWELEQAMRRLMVVKFKTLPLTHPDAPLQQEVTHEITVRGYSLTSMGVKSMVRYTRNSSYIVQEAPLAIQSDADEIITEPALAHLKHCALKCASCFPLYAPCFNLKGNAMTLQHTGPTELSINLEDSSELLNYLWKAGPSIHLLYDMIRKNDTCRLISPAQINPHNHMGLGAAVHLSSIDEPAEMWLKSLYTHHGRENREYLYRAPVAFIEAGKRGEISPALIRSAYRNQSHLLTASDTGSSSVCGNVCWGVHYQAVTGGEKVYQSLPWALRYNPQRYPFIVSNCTEACIV